MGAISRADKVFGIAFFITYAVGIGLLSLNWLTGTITLAIAGWCLYQSNEPGFLDIPSSRNQFFLLLGAFFIPAIFIGIHFYNEHRDLAHFKKYLATHECKPFQSVIASVTPQRCDRYGGCEDAEEVEEIEYLCSLTNTRIRFSGFARGLYEE